MFKQKWNGLFLQSVVFAIFAIAIFESSIHQLLKTKRHRRIVFIFKIVKYEQFRWKCRWSFLNYTYGWSCSNCRKSSWGSYPEFQWQANSEINWTLCCGKVPSWTRIWRTNRLNCLLRISQPILLELPTSRVTIPEPSLPMSLLLQEMCNEDGDGRQMQDLSPALLNDGFSTLKDQSVSVSCYCRAYLFLFRSRR